MAIARLTSKGQVTIPVEVRRALKAEEGDDIVFSLTDTDAATIRVIKRRRLTDLYGVLPATHPYPGKEHIRAEVRKVVARGTMSGSAGDDRR